MAGPKRAQFWSALLFIRGPLSPKFDTVTHAGRGLAVGVRKATDLAREPVSRFMDVLIELR